jgi:hypothetical protein
MNMDPLQSAQIANAVNQETPAPPQPPVAPQPINLPEPPKQKNSSIIFILSLTTIVACLIAAFFYWQNTKLIKETTNIQTPSPTSTPDITANWKTYENTKYSFIFKYPSTFSLSSAPVGKNENKDIYTSNYVILMNQDKGLMYFTVSTLATTPPSQRGYLETEKIGELSFAKSSFPNGDGPDLTPFVKYEISNKNNTFIINAVGYSPISGDQKQIISTFKFTDQISKFPVTGTVKPSPTPFGLNDPISDQGICSPSENKSLFPATGPAPLKVALAPVGSFNYTYSTTAGFQWDYDGNGTWDEYTVYDPNYMGNYYYTYTTTGTYRPKTRARSAKNTWSPTCTYAYDVIVTSTQPEFSDTYLMVNKTNLSVTASKSSNNTANNNGHLIIIVPGFTVSAKDQPITIRAKDIATHEITGIYNGYGLAAGASYPINLFVDSGQPNGTYSDKQQIEYWSQKDNKWIDGPIISYSINLTN